MLECYLTQTATPLDERFLFHPIQHTKHLRSSGKVSCSCLGELFKKKLKSLGFAANLLCLHSLRTGGAMAAAMPDRLFKRHGRWQLEKAKDRYVKGSLEARLSASKKLGMYPLCYLHNYLLCESTIVIMSSQPTVVAQPVVLYVCAGVVVGICCG